MGSQQHLSVLLRRLQHAEFGAPASARLSPSRGLLSTVFSGNCLRIFNTIGSEPLAEPAELVFEVEISQIRQHFWTSFDTSGAVFLFIVTPAELHTVFFPSQNLTRSHPCKISRSEDQESSIWPVLSRITSSARSGWYSVLPFSKLVQHAGLVPSEPISVLQCMSTASDHAHIAFAAGGHTLVRVAVSPRGEIRATDTFICPSDVNVTMWVVTSAKLFYMDTDGFFRSYSDEVTSLVAYLTAPCLDIWDQTKQTNQSIYLPNCFGLTEQGASRDFVSFDVSADLIFACFEDRFGSFYVLDIDRFVRSHSNKAVLNHHRLQVTLPGSERLSGTDSESDEEDFEIGRPSQHSRWYDSRAPVWSPQKSQPWVESIAKPEASTLYRRSWDPLGSSSRTSTNVNGFTKHTRDTKQSPVPSSPQTSEAHVGRVGEHFVVPKPYDLQLVQFVVSPCMLVALLSKGEEKAIFLVDRAKAEERVVPLPPGALPIIDPQSAVVHYLTSEGLHALIAGDLSEDSLTNGIIIFDKPSMADELFALNGWDRRLLRLHTLSLGLRYRQLDVIEPALKSLDEDQVQRGTKMLLEFVRKNAQATQDEHFWDALFCIGMGFVGSIIQSKAAAMNTSSETYSEILKFSRYLSELRAAQVELKMTALRRTTEVSAPIFQSPFTVHKTRSRLAREGAGDLGESNADKLLVINLFGSQRDSGLTASSTPVDMDASSFSPASPDQVGDALGDSGIVFGDGDSSHASLESRANDSLELMQSFGPNRDRWEKMRAFEVVADALASSSLSMALAFLRWRSNVVEGAPPHSTDIRETVNKLIFEVLSHSQYNLAAKMIRNVGDSLEATYKEMLWCTSNRAVRTYLWNHLRGNLELPHEQETLRFANEMEALYTAETYSTEYTRVFLANQSANEAPELVESIPYHGEFVCADLVDFDPKEERLVPASAHEVAEGQTAGFLWTRLKWLDAIHYEDASSRLRLLLEGLLLRDRKWNEIFELAARDMEAILKLFATHNNWDGVLQVLATEPDAPPVAATLLSLSSSLIAEFGRQKLLRWLLVRGVVVAEERSSLRKLLSRVSGSGFLFSGRDTLEALSLADTAPFGSLSAYHLNVIQYCIDAKLPSLLQSYLDHFQLARTQEQITQILNSGLIKSDRTWVKLAFLVRSPSTLADASLMNAKMCLGIKKLVSVDSMIASTAKEKRPFMALGTVIYSPLSFNTAIDASKESPFRIDKRQLRDFLAKFPVLLDALLPDAQSKRSTTRDYVHAALGDLRSSRHDSDLLALLAEQTPFSLEDLLGLRESDQRAIFSMPRFSQLRFTDVVDPTYYLARAEPFKAYNCLLTSTSQATKGRSRAILNLSLPEMTSLVNTVRRVAFAHISRVEVLAACVCLLDLCDLTSHELRVDVAAAKFLIDEAAGDEEVVMLFLQFPSSVAINEVARRLSSSLVANKSKHSAPWTVLSEFCHVHQLPVAPHVLKELAESANWVQFLADAQMLGYQHHEVLGITSAFEQQGLREHVSESVLRMSRSTSAGLKTADAERGLGSDMFSAVIAAGNRIYPGETLLQHAVAIRQPLLAVIALFYPDVTPLNCMIVWLHSIVAKTSDSVFRPLTFEHHIVTDKTPATQASTRLQINDATTDLSAVNSIHTLSGYITFLSGSAKHRQFLLRAFQIFDPTHPFVFWMLFHQALLHHRYQDARQFLRQYTERIRDPSAPSMALKIGTIDWLSNLSIELADKMVSSGTATPFELRQLLALLVEAKLADKYELMLKNLQMIQRVNLELAAQNDFFVLPEPASLVEALVHKGHFDPARHLAMINGVPVDSITLEEARHMELDYVNRSLWDLSSDRMHLWGTIQALFKQRKCRASFAVEFFLQRAYGIAKLLLEAGINVGATISLQFQLAPGPQFPDNTSILDCLNELISLLGFARPWIESAPVDETNAWLIEAAAPAASRVLVRQDLLQDIDAQMLRSSVMAQAEASNPSRRKLTRTESRPNPSQLLTDMKVLDSMIGKLLNEGNFTEAEKLCTELAHTSEDMLLVRTMIAVATGTNSPSGLPGEVAEIIARKLGSVPSQSILERLESLAKCAVFARECCDRILVFSRVGALFSLAYADMTSRDPYDVLHFLLIEGPDQYSLTKQFITILKLDRDRVSQVIGERAFRAISEIDGNFTRLMQTPEKSGPSRRIERDPSMDNLAFSLFSSADSLSRASSSSELNSVDSGSLGGRQMSWLASESSPALNSPANVASPMGTPIKRGLENKRFWSSRYFPEYLDLTPNCGGVGDELLRQLQKMLTASPQVEVEVFIRALMCFRRAQDVQRQSKLYQTIKDRVPTYVATKNFKALVRLVTGTRQFTQLQYVLDLLVKADCFELLLSRGMYEGSEEEDKRELAMSLYSFLRSNYPTHTEKMKLLFLRFGMYREYADILHERAWASLNAMKTRLDPSMLLNAMDCFIEAATNYAKDKAFVLERKCLDHAELIRLQFDIPDVRLVNLKPGEAEQFIMSCPEFEYVLTVANAYALNSLSDWIETIYTHCVKSGDIAFYDDFNAAVLVDSAELFSKTTKKFKTDPDRNRFASNMRKFLEHVDDLPLRARLAVEAGFADLVDGLSHSVPGFEYFVGGPGINVNIPADEADLDD